MTMTDTANGIHSILVGLDGSTLAETILPTLRALARRCRAEIVLLHVVHVPKTVPAEAGIALDEVVEQERREAAGYLRRLARELDTDGIAVRTAVVVGETAPEIVRFAEHEHIDLVALATHGRSGMQRLLHGSVADAVLHTATRPLLLLRPSLETPAPADIRRLVVALDGSPLAEQALPPARELARALGVPLVLLSVVDLLQPAFAADPYGGVSYPRILTILEEGTEQYLAEVAVRERKHGVTVETVRATGNPSEVIAHYVKAHPDSLLVLGTHGRSGWRAALIGSVARRVVLLASAPVLVVRAKPPTA
jgi:nucleotide-binding universal stress UspA family protein